MNSIAKLVQAMCYALIAIVYRWHNIADINNN